MTEPNAPKNPKPSSRLSGYAKYSGIAFQMIAIIGIGSYGGVKLDEIWPNKYSLFTIICSLASVVIAMYFVIRQVNSSKDDDA